MTVAVQAESACQHPNPDNPSTVCGAAAAADQRCLAHLSPDSRSGWLAALAPGSDIDARGVTFSEDLLTELLYSLPGHQGHFFQIGTADFSDATFTGDADFGRAIFTGTARFGRTTFTGTARFGRTTFNAGADFSDATFTRDAVFAGATFNAGDVFGDPPLKVSARFSDATFTGDATFGGATFTGNAWFTHATFNGTASFSDATFNADAAFSRATFNGDAEFAHASVALLAMFNSATFTRTGRFGDVTFLTVSFNAAVVQGELQMEAAAREVIATRLRGEGRVSLRLRAGTVDLTDVVLTGSVSVHGRGGAAQVPPVRVMSLLGLDASSVTLTDVDLSQCRFAGLRADQIVLDGQCVFADGPGARRRVLAEEHHWRASRAAGAGGRPQETDGWRRLPEREGERVEDLEEVGPARLEVLYRQLRKALEDAKNEPGAADFYYGEMEMRREAATRRTERWLLVLYWAISGYGLRARRALAWLALLTVLSIGALTWFGFPQTATYQHATGTVTAPAGQQPIDLTIRQSDAVKPLADRVEKATEVTLNAVIFRNPDADLTTPGRYLNITIRILGPILLGLTILAIRNQVKR